ncbi:DHH family phosphoesterase [Halovenus rubra]|uniref:DHH family phosphoesterase n=2 Tax=Halovenus rubra TaxID=869890 RepID=A0ACC7E1H8_9EURY|nr:recombinase RecJ [Halovenus rubra]
MQDWLIEDEQLSIGRKSVLPGAGFFYPDSLEEQEAEREAEETLTGSDVVVVADPDADGLACTALVRLVHGEGALLPAGPHELEEALEWVAEYANPEATVYVCDLCPDSESDIDALPDAVSRLASFSWYDHHQWDDDLATQVRETGVDLTVGESDEVCTADVALNELDHTFDDRFEELAAVTRDHDLWIRDDERSDDLADYAYWTDPEEYVETVLEHGVDFPAEVDEFLAEQRIEKEALIEKAIERAEMREAGPWTIGVTYGRCSQNEVAEALREQGSDAAVIVKPAGSASIRGTETFERCHEVAAQVNGGGHPKAAGCKPDIYDDMLDYAHHWTTQGAVAKQAIIGAFQRLADDTETESDNASDE